MLKSKLTERSQTTVPTGVREALGLQAGDNVGYVIKGDYAIIRRVEAQSDDEGADPALGAFLDMLERDIQDHPERLRGIPQSLVKRARALVARTGFHADSPIRGPVAL